MASQGQSRLIGLAASAKPGASGAYTFEGNLVADTSSNPTKVDTIRTNFQLGDSTTTQLALNIAAPDDTVYIIQSTSQTVAGIGSATIAGTSIGISQSGIVNTSTALVDDIFNSKQIGTIGGDLEVSYATTPNDGSDPLVTTTSVLLRTSPIENEVQVSALRVTGGAVDNPGTSYTLPQYGDLSQNTFLKVIPNTVTGGYKIIGTSILPTTVNALSGSPNIVVTPDPGVPTQATISTANNIVITGTLTSAGVQYPAPTAALTNGQNYVLKAGATVSGVTPLTFVDESAAQNPGVKKVSGLAETLFKVDDTTDPANPTLADSAATTALTAGKYGITVTAGSPNTYSLTTITDGTGPIANVDTASFTIDSSKILKIGGSATTETAKIYGLRGNVAGTATWEALPNADTPYITSVDGTLVVNSQKLSLNPPNTTDGKQYCIKNGVWSEVTGTGGGSVAIDPTSFLGSFATVPPSSSTIGDSGAWTTFLGKLATPVINKTFAFFQQITKSPSNTITYSQGLFDTNAFISINNPTPGDPSILTYNIPTPASGVTKCYIQKDASGVITYADVDTGIKLAPSSSSTEVGVGVSASDIASFSLDTDADTWTLTANQSYEAVFAKLNVGGLEYPVSISGTLTTSEQAVQLSAKNDGTGKVVMTAAIGTGPTPSQPTHSVGSIVWVNPETPSITLWSLLDAATIYSPDLPVPLSQSFDFNVVGGVKSVNFGMPQYIQPLNFSTTDPLPVIAASLFLNTTDFELPAAYQPKRQNTFLGIYPCVCIGSSNNTSDPGSNSNLLYPNIANNFPTPNQVYFSYTGIKVYLVATSTPNYYTIKISLCDDFNGYAYDTITGAWGASSFILQTKNWFGGTSGLPATTSELMQYQFACPEIYNASTTTPPTAINYGIRPMTFSYE